VSSRSIKGSEWGLSEGCNSFTILKCGDLYGDDIDLVRVHVNTLHPFFLDAPLHAIYLFGTKDLSSGYPHAAATLHQFTYLSDMIQKPMMVFSKFSADVENSSAIPLDLLATSSSVLDWKSQVWATD
jgi:hypothetical protein